MSDVIVVFAALSCLAVAVIIGIKIISEYKR